MNNRIAAAAVAACLGLSLTACGGSTAKSDKNSSTTTTSTTSSAAPSSSAGANTVPEDQSTLPKASEGRGAEVSAVPDPAPPLSEQDKHYLDDLNKQGVNTKGMEGDIVNAGRSMCGPDPQGNDAMAGFLAGQLAEQQRSDKSPEELKQIVKDNNQTHCK